MIEASFAVAGGGYCMQQNMDFLVFKPVSSVLQEYKGNMLNSGRLNDE